MDKYKGIDDISFEDMLDFAEKYTRELYVKASLKGNYSEELALNVMNSLLATLKCKKVQEVSSTEVFIPILGSTKCDLQPTSNPSHSS